MAGNVNWTEGLLGDAEFSDLNQTSGALSEQCVWLLK
jgi:hypothetical protein